MAPLPFAAQSAARSPPNIVGGNDSALSWNALLAFGAVMIAAMQGTLVMESADPCRISYKKWKMLMALEALEVIIVVASEVVSFVELRSSLDVRLEWLQWVPPSILTVGLLELLLDIWFTLRMAVQSRLNWTPFSGVCWHKKGERAGVRSLFEVVPLLVTAVLSVVLIGWRQRWWWAAVAVGETIARKAASESGGLSNGAFGFCIGWGLLLSVASFSCVVALEVSAMFDGEPNLFQKIIGSRNPTAYYANNSDERALQRRTTVNHLEMYDLCYR